MKICFVAFSVLVFSGLANHAQQPRNDKHYPFDSIFTFIYNQQFSKAEKELTFAKEDLGTLEYQILYIDLNWWKSIKAIKVEDFSEFRIKLEALMKEKPGESENPELSELIRLSYYIRMSAHENHYFAVLSKLGRVNQLVEILEKKPLSANKREIFEVYKAILQILKSKITLSESKKKAGILVLEKYITSEKLILKTISNYFIGKVYFEMDNKPVKSLPFFRELNHMYPHHSIFREYIQRCEPKKDIYLP